jgi:DNA-binding MarR family transcriptional regulator
MLRSIVEELWNNNGEIRISNSEWFIMSRIYKKQPTISYVSKDVNMSRQAVHKFVKSLESRGLINITNSKNNNKEKCLQLTSLGEECYEKNLTLKAILEDRITEKIGAERLKILKDILKSDWGL